MFSNAEVCNFDSQKDFETKLEPRLVEYLKKKQFYKENGIETHNNIMEKEFSIDKNDIIKIKNYLQGKKLKKNQSHSDMIQPSVAHFPSEELKADSRLQKIKNKQQRDRDAIEQKNNYDVMARGYDMYRNDRKFASAYGNDFKSRFNPQVWMNDEKNNSDSDGSDFENSNPNISNPRKNPQQNFEPLTRNSSRNYNEEQHIDMKRRYSNPNIYKNKPASIRYKDYMTRGCNEDLASTNYSLDSIIGKLDTYREDLSQHRRQRVVDSDIDVSIPSYNNNNNNNNNYNYNKSNKREKENNYRAIPLMNGSKQKDVDIENYLCYGNGPSRGAKSLGYPNPAEHYFQYISDDISKPEHTVFEPGMPTRMHNKDTARPYKTRDVM
jgi:hypothetical protein